MSTILKRDNEYLNNLLNQVLNEYLPDLEIKNPIKVQFSRQNIRRLGSITLKKDSKTGEEYSLIRLNGHFINFQVPEYVLQATLIHELIHYLHGFNSHYAQKYRYPHKNRVVTREFTTRSLEKILKLQKAWLKNNWVSFLKENHLFIHRVKPKKRFRFKIKLGR